MLTGQIGMEDFGLQSQLWYLGSIITSKYDIPLAFMVPAAFKCTPRILSFYKRDQRLKIQSINAVSISTL